MSSVPSVVVVSIDGVAPAHIDQVTMPRLCELALAGASTFEARTVSPPVTLPAHTSMFRGVAPSVHGITDNTPLPLDESAPSFLRTARQAGSTTWAALSWLPIDAVVERDATTHRTVVDGGYDPCDDDTIIEWALAEIDRGPGVGFVYLCAPDLAGHAEGWGSPAYRAALHGSDRRLGRLLDHIDRVAPGTAVLVTTDHGGHGQVHDGQDPIDEVVFVTLRCTGIEPASTWARPVTILDVAPTVAALTGTEPPSTWSGTSLLSGVVSIVDELEAALRSMADVHYGEDVTMLEHALQTAANLAADHATDELQVAGLLHDIGHLRGPAGRWGRPDHAHDGARHLQAWLPPAVVEPVRGHVDAKRHLVATEPAYAAALSEASRQTLRQQGGPFSEQEAAEFGAGRWSDDALTLRRADDEGKRPGAHSGVLDDWVPLLRAVIGRRRPPAPVLRDACVCAECRDVTSGQRLLTAADLEGWHVRGMRQGAWVLVGPHGVDHIVELADTSVRPGVQRLLERSLPPRRLPDDLVDFRRDLVEQGIALGVGLPVHEGAVLDLAGQLGHVRSTNYGDVFDVRNEATATNLAYTALGLPLHTDNPYREPVPTVQLLHCLVAAADGGHSRFVDGFAEAELLRSDDPRAFDLLATTMVPFEFRSADTWLHARRPIIETDVEGSVTAVSVNHRSMQPPAAGDGAGRWYDAYGAFVARLEASRHAVELHLQPGEVVAFDNRRMLHARSSFDTAQPRHLQGCYIDIDAVRSSVAIDDVER